MPTIPRREPPYYWLLVPPNVKSINCQDYTCIYYCDSESGWQLVHSYCPDTCQCEDPNKAIGNCPDQASASVPYEVYCVVSDQLPSQEECNICRIQCKNGRWMQIIENAPQCKPQCYCPDVGNSCNTENLIKSNICLKDCPKQKCILRCSVGSATWEIIQTCENNQKCDCLPENLPCQTPVSTTESPCTQKCGTCIVQCTEESGKYSWYVIQQCDSENCICPLENKSCAEDDLLQVLELTCQRTAPDPDCGTCTVTCIQTGQGQYLWSEIVSCTDTNCNCPENNKPCTQEEFGYSKDVLCTKTTSSPNCGKCILVCNEYVGKWEVISYCTGSNPDCRCSKEGEDCIPEVDEITEADCIYSQVNCDKCKVRCDSSGIWVIDVGCKGPPSACICPPANEPCNPQNDTVKEVPCQNVGSKCKDTSCRIKCNQNTKKWELVQSCEGYSCQCPDVGKPCNPNVDNEKTLTCIAGTCQKCQAECVTNNNNQSWKVTQQCITSGCVCSVAGLPCDTDEVNQKVEADCIPDETIACGLCELTCKDGTWKVKKNCPNRYCLCPSANQPCTENVKTEPCTRSACTTYTCSVQCQMFYDENGDPLYEWVEVQPKCPGTNCVCSLAGSPCHASQQGMIQRNVLCKKRISPACGKCVKKCNPEHKWILDTACQGNNQDCICPGIGQACNEINAKETVDCIEEPAQECGHCTVKCQQNNNNWVWQYATNDDTSKCKNSDQCNCGLLGKNCTPEEANVQKTVKCNAKPDCDTCTVGCRDNVWKIITDCPENDQWVCKCQYSTLGTQCDPSVDPDIIIACQTGQNECGKCTVNCQNNYWELSKNCTGSSDNCRCPMVGKPCSNQGESLVVDCTTDPEEECGQCTVYCANSDKVWVVTQQCTSNNNTKTHGCICPLAYQQCDPTVEKQPKTVKCEKSTNKCSSYCTVSCIDNTWQITKQCQGTGNVTCICEHNNIVGKSCDASSQPQNYSCTQINECRNCPEPDPQPTCGTCTAVCNQGKITQITSGCSNNCICSVNVGDSCFINTCIATLTAHCIPPPCPPSNPCEGYCSVVCQGGIYNIGKKCSSDCTCQIQGYLGQPCNTENAVVQGKCLSENNNGSDTGTTAQPSNCHCIAACIYNLPSGHYFWYGVTCVGGQFIVDRIPCCNLTTGEECANNVVCTHQITPGSRCDNETVHHNNTTAAPCVIQG